MTDDFLVLVLQGYCAVLKGLGRLSSISGGYGEGETPLPFPNRAVKPLSADGTWPARARESRSPPVSSAQRIAPWAIRSSSWGRRVMSSESPPPDRCVGGRAVQMPMRPIAGAPELPPTEWPATPAGWGVLAMRAMSADNRSDWGPRSRVRCDRGAPLGVFGHQGGDRS